MQRSDTIPPTATRSPLVGLVDGLAVTVAALAAMVLVAAVGLWLAHADTLPGNGFLSVVAATVLMALGTPIDLDGSAAFVATAQGGITALPLTVSLAGALVAGVLFVRPIRLHAVVGTGELLRRVLWTAGLWTVAVLLFSLAARHTFTVETGEPIVDELGDLLGAAPVVGFRAPPGPAIGWGLLWLAVVLAVTLAVSRSAPLPSAALRFHAAVRPTAHAVLTALLVCVALALVAGVATALARGDQGRETVAVMFLALPNLAWLGLGIGMGGSWQGHVSGSLGLPFPEPLAGVLRSDENVTLDLGTLAEHDGRAWLLLPAAAVILLLTGIGMAMHAPPGLPAWRHALHLAVALALTMLLICLATRITAAYGLSLLGLGGGGSATLRPNWLLTIALGAGWGAVTGFLGGLVATRARRRP
ncbi:streptophobe family protein [Kitasatospora camelliae]|uniref:Streptophobe family protein n=1 Tax=Kitasatospora camelliae TaxID=3156397 RepID=A0AAU8K6G2_9ACTN